ncbi:MAG: hypothetical protein GY804_07605 [Alphaproteobacteria bacterium]|nr:hypothetical protein [Alphaproteobacteria bacterium]
MNDAQEVAVLKLASGFENFIRGFKGITIVNAANIQKAQLGFVLYEAADSYLTLKSFQQECVQGTLPGFKSGLNAFDGNSKAFREAVVNCDPITIIHQDAIGAFFDSVEMAHIVSEHKKSKKA